MSAAKSPDKPRRPWYRPHLSTWVLTALVALFFCLWNVAGYYREREPSWDSTASIHTRGPQVWAYGWPATYVERAVGVEVSKSQDGTPLGVRFTESLTWRMWERVTSFAMSNLIFDAVIAVGASLLLGWSFEFWRCRRARVLQVYLWELGVLAAMMCMALAGGRHLILSAAATEKELREAQIDGMVHIQSETPECVHQWLPGNLCKAGDFVVGATLNGLGRNDSSIQFQMETISRQQRLRWLRLFSHCPSDSWEKVAGCRQLEEINIGRSCLVDSDLAVLARLPRLRKLDLTMGSLNGGSLRHVGEIRTLEELTVNGMTGRLRMTEFEDSQLLKGRDLQPLAALSLTKLNLAFNELGTNDCDLTAVGKMEYLRKLHIRNRRLTKQDVTALRQLSALDDLTLGNCEFEDAEDQKLLPTR